MPGDDNVIALEPRRRGRPRSKVPGQPKTEKAAQEARMSVEGPVAVQPYKRKHSSTGRPRGGRNVVLENGVRAQEHRYSPLIAAEILDRVAAGESVSQICRSDPNKFPHPQKVVEWKYRADGFAVAFARAKEIRADILEDQLLDLSDDDEIDPSVKRVKFDMKKWIMSKDAPLTYGDKVTIAGDPNAPLRQVVELREVVSSFNEAELAALERFNNEMLAAREIEATEGSKDPSTAKK